MQLNKQSKTFAGTLGCLLLFAILSANQAQARSPWEVQHPTLPAQETGAYTPAQIPGQLHNGMPPQLSKDFWGSPSQGALLNRLQPGIVLTGIMESEVSSAKSKAGDIFAITLAEGYVQNGMQIIPRGSKVVGAVNSVSKAQSHGRPGSLQVSLQSLVLPDGSHVPFSGFIVSNPNHAFKDPSRKKNLGFDIRDTGHHLSGMLGSFTNGVGFVYARRYRGNEFFLERGEALPLRLNKTLLIPEEQIKPVETAGLPPGAQSGASRNNPAGASAPAVPGLTAPGMNPLPAPPFSSQTQMVPGLVGDSDPFNLPLNSPAMSAKDMPEPF